MRWACLLLPHLAIDAVLRQQPDPGMALALVTGPSQRRVLHAVSPAARRLGLRRGMLLSAAQVLTRDFAIQDHDPRLDQQAYAMLATWAYGFSSQVSTDFAPALILEIGASRALFGEWPDIERRLRSELTKLGFRHRLVAAPFPHAARVLAQALDERLPVLERTRFLSIFTSNLDEFVMKRVGWLQRAEQMFAQPKYLFIGRHPYPVLESMVRNRFNRSRERCSAAAYSASFSPNGIGKACCSQVRATTAVSRC